MTEVQPTEEAIAEDSQGNPLSVDTGESNGFRWTVKRRRFCHQFIANGGRVGRASLDAGYQNESEGAYLLSLTPIRRWVEIALRNQLMANEVTEDSVVARWQNWADCTPADFFEYHAIALDGGVDEAGNALPPRQLGQRLSLKNLDDLPPRQRRQLKKIVVKDTQHGQDVTIEVQDQARANERLAQVLGMLNSDSQLSNVPAPEEAAKLIHSFLEQADEVDQVPAATPAAAEEPSPA